MLVEQKYRNLFLRFRVHWRLAILAIVAGTLAFSSGAVFAQTSADGTIHGRIADSSGSRFGGS